MNIEEIVTKQDDEAQKRLAKILAYRPPTPSSQYHVYNKDVERATVDKEALLHLGRCLRVWCADPTLKGWERSTRMAFNDCRLFFKELEETL